ncbi:MAG: SurA N-terminal domain-containing protein [Candidatus Pacebacteria bacterium]|nr:SurA N-terminal domain-containing protein [Candidatus Paceibacterota bacterium]
MPLYKQPWVWIVLLAVLISGSIILFKEGDSILNENEESEVALTVNGSEISKEEFLSYTENIIEYQMEVYGLSEEEVMDSAVKLATQKVVLSAYIDEKGIEATEEEVQEKYDEYKQYYPTPSGETLPAFEEAREDIEYEVRIDKLIEMYTAEAEVTDEEVNSFYEIQKIQMEQMGEGEMPSFEESEEDIREYLLEEKAISTIQEDLEQLIEDAEVEMFITIDEIDFPEKEEADLPEVEIEDENNEEGDDTEEVETETEEE